MAVLLQYSCDSFHLFIHFYFLRMKYLCSILLSSPVYIFIPFLKPRTLLYKSFLQFLNHFCMIPVFNKPKLTNLWCLKICIFISLKYTYSMFLNSFKEYFKYYAKAYRKNTFLRKWLKYCWDCKKNYNYLCTNVKVWICRAFFLKIQIIYSFNGEINIQNL